MGFGTHRDKCYHWLLTGLWEQTLTKTQDNQLVPKSSAVMSEVADVTDTILKNAAAAPLLKALGDPVIAKHFKSISVC